MLSHPRAYLITDSIRLPTLFCKKLSLCIHRYVYAYIHVCSSALFSCLPTLLISSTSSKDDRLETMQTTLKLKIYKSSNQMREVC